MKRVISEILVLVLCATLSISAHAVAAEQSEPSLEQEVSVARAEETVWYYRLYNGQQQKRLWSITYMYWKTEWIPY